MLYNVPWAIEGGAYNQTELARVLAYAATSGNDGVLGLADLKVSQMDTPGAGVKVATGLGIVPCRTVGYANQTYIGGRPTADDTVPVAANGGGATRYDMVVLRVKNPWLSGETWPVPTDATVGPYEDLAIITPVTAAVIASPAAARAYLKSINLSAIALAGLTVPTSTSSILNSMVTDLRNVANPRRIRPGILTYNPTDATRTVTSSTFADWFYLASWQVDVPDWATHMTVIGQVAGARLDKQSSSTAGKVNGQTRIQLGRDGNAVYTQGAGYDFDANANSGSTRANVVCADTIAVPVAYRGTRQNLTIQALRNSSGTNQPLIADQYSFGIIDAEFSERAV